MKTNLITHVIRALAVLLLSCVSALAAPSISTQPLAQTKNQGQSASFSVAATGAGTLTYQWQKDGVNIPSATSSTFSLASAQPQHIGYYTCKVTDSVGTVTSQQAALNINGVPFGGWQGQVAYYPFNGNANNESGTGINGIPFQATLANDRFGTAAKAYSFDGIDDTIGTNDASATSDASPTTASSNCTLSVWFKALAQDPLAQESGGETSYNHSYVIVPHHGGAGSGVGIAAGTNGIVILEHGNGFLAPVLVYSSALGSSWNHAVVTVSNDGPPELYLNGTKVRTGLATGRHKTMSAIQDISNGIGGGGYGHFNGSIDDVRIYNRALSASEVQALYTIESTSSPTVTLTGSNPLTFEAAASYTDPGATANDVEDGALTPTITSNTVVSNVPGSYAVTWSATDSNNNTGTAVRTVNVVDTTAPAVTVPANLVVEATSSAGALVNYPAATVTDVVGVTSFNYSKAVGTVFALGVNTVTVTASDAAGNTGTGSFTVTVRDTTAPVITQLPPAQSVTTQGAGTSAAVPNVTALVLATDAVGVNSITQSPVAGSLRTSGPYQITVTVADAAGNTSTSLVSLSVNDPIVITAHPQNLTLNPGASATFSVSATGTGPISYQWKKGAAPIDGATSSSYTIPSLVEGDEGSYSVVVTNIVGSVNSSAATLSVNDPITITAQPISQTLNPGASATFSVTATGTGPINYQWRKNGLAIATGSTLTIADVSNSDEGEYTVIVSNVVGSVVSSKAVLSVNDPIVITAQPVSTFVHEGGSVSFSVAVSGTEPLSYLWHHDNQPMASVTTPTLTISEAKEADAGSYHCVVTNVVGSVTSNAATLEVRLKPRITRQPESKEVRSKAAVTFSAEASGHAPLSYQWFKDGAELTGQTQAALTLEQVGTAQAGSYTVRVRNEAGEALSAAAQLRLVIWSEVDGTYQGLLVRDNGAAPEQSPYPGRLTVTLTSQGAMSGSLEYAGLTHRFAGKFAPELNYARIFARKGQSSLELKMALDASDLVLSAWVNEVAVAGAAAPQEPSETALALQPFNSRTNPAPQTGRYTMLLRPTADVVEGPQVPGYATVSINSSGAAKITGKLPDGSVVGCSALLAEDGTIGVYEGLYRKVYPYAGHVSGPVRFDPDGGELAVSGSMEWRKPAQETGALWPQGFVTALETEGSFYVPPTRGIRVLDLAAGTDTLDLTLEGPITGDLFTREVRLSTGNKFLIDAPNAEKLSLKLDAKTGIVTGEFFDLGVRKTRKLEGVVLPESNQIEGFFLGGSSSGSILIAPTQ